MSDYNVQLPAVEEAMDILSAYRRELNDRRAAVAFALTDLRAAVDRAVLCGTREAEGFQGSTDTYSVQRYQALHDDLAALQELQHRCATTGEDLLSEWRACCSACDQLAEDGFAQAGRYLQKLNRIVGAVAPSADTAPDTVRTIILDSSLYPQTAEHIRAAQNRGLPSLLTLDRAGAKTRRRLSLADTSVRSDYDRDEYPCAMFAQGGAGADVAYISGGDNRGAGSALQWQLRRLPDGTAVRIRVI